MFCLNQFTTKHAILTVAFLTTATCTCLGIKKYNDLSYINGKTEGYTSGYTDGCHNTLGIVGKTIKKMTDEETSLTSDNILSNHILTEKRIYAIMNVSNPDLSKEEQRLYIKYIVKFAKKYNLSPILVAAVIHRESNFRNKLTSTVGAAGPMQVWAKWHTEKLKKHKLTEEHLYTIQYGILVGCEVLREYINAENGNFRNALYKYVGGQHHGYVKDIFAMCEYAFKIKI